MRSMGNKKRLRRTMMFLNTQRPALVKDAFVYEPDSVIFDLEDAVSMNQKDAARISLYYALKTDYHGVERIVRINGTDTNLWENDVRCCVAGGADGIRIPKCEVLEDVRKVEAAVEAAEKEFGRPVGSTLLMAAIETPLGVIHAYELAKSSERIFGISIGAGDYIRTMHATRTSSGEEMFAARANVVIAARAADIQCFDTVHFQEVYNLEALEKETILIKNMGFDGKSVINPLHIPIIHNVFTPSPEEIARSEKIIFAIREQAGEGIGVFVKDGMQLDIANLEPAERVIALAKAAGVYRGAL